MPIIFMECCFFLNFFKIICVLISYYEIDSFTRFRKFMLLAFSFAELKFYKFYCKQNALSEIHSRIRQCTMNIRKRTNLLEHLTLNILYILIIHRLNFTHVLPYCFNICIVLSQSIQWIQFFIYFFRMFLNRFFLHVCPVESLLRIVLCCSSIRFCYLMDDRMEDSTIPNMEKKFHW